MAGTCFPSSELEVEDLNEDFYVFKSRKWPESWLEVPSVGNGHLATVIKCPWMHMSGLFNGNETNSQRAKIPSTVGVKMKSPSDDQLIEYKLDTRIGTFIEQHKIDGWVITLQWFAHRTILPILVFQVVVNKDEINMKSQNQDSTAKCVNTKSNLDSLSIEFDISRMTNSEDIDLEELTSKFTNAGFYRGRTKIPEHPELSKCQEFYILHDLIPEILEVQKTQNFKKWTFITSIHYSKDVVEQAYRQGKELEKFDNLEKSHRNEWLKLWNSGRIELQGNVKCSRAAASSLYNIFNSIPIQMVNPSSSEETDRTESYTTLFTGLSPSGLPWGDEESYQGHTFWDAETWMFPAMLMLHHELSATLLHSRVRTVDVAARNARASGLKGLRYPWESALTGIETAPEEECGQFEIHINGDISMAILQYMKISPYRKDFPESYLNILKGIGDFWLSRAEYDSHKQHYEIKGVMPPDEYARYVNNSAYTNAVASLSLRGAYVASKMSDDPKASIYEEAAAKMYIPYNAEHDYHPEFDGFKMGTTIKQADVVLLGFPLMMEMMNSTRKNDLTIYEKTTSEKGPAMSDSMHAVGWLEVGEEKRAHESFARMFQHITGDFQVWTEEKGGKGSPNFITGMGGYLQALLFGYGGLRILDDSLKINPSIMENTSSIAWHGINYRGCSFYLNIDKSKAMTLTLTRTTEMVKVSFEVPEKGRILLEEGHPLNMNATVGFLRVEKS